MESLTQMLLTAATDPDYEKRTAAEKQLKEAEANNAGQFYTALAKELASDAKDATSRQLAGILLKNSVSAQDRSLDQERKTRWLELDEGVKNNIKDTVLSALSATQPAPRVAACQVIAKVGACELPLGKWPNLVPVLLNVVTEGDNTAKQTALTALSYLCEELANIILNDGATADIIPSDLTNSILTAVVQGMRLEDASCKEAATKALYHALVLAQRNFDNETERNFIFQVVSENCKGPNGKVQVAAFECLVQIATEYYDYLQPYMAPIATLTLDTIKTAPETVAIPAMELWSTVCDEELFLKELELDAQAEGKSPERTSQRFIAQALPLLLPILLDTLTKQSEEVEDEWTLAMASGTCLSLVAQVVGDAIIEHVLTFVQNNYQSAQWNQREAAILAYGSIMEGPSSDKLAQPVASSFTFLMGLLGDPSVAVRDTTAWTIARIAQFHETIIAEHVGNSQAGLVKVLLEKLKDEPRVAANICWVIHVLAETHPYDAKDPPAQCTILSEPFFSLARELIVTASRPDAEEKNLGEAAYSALSMLIGKAGMDCVPMMEQITVAILEKLEATFQITAADPNYHKVMDVQGSLCGCLQVLTVRLKEKIQPVKERLFAAYMKVIQQYGQTHANSIHEEALLAISALAFALGENFEVFLPHFFPYLQAGLSNYEETTVCRISNEVVGDLCRAMGSKMLPYCEPILNALYNNLQNPKVDRKLKPVIMVCFGDIAMAITGEFEKTLQPVVAVLAEASATRIEHGPQDNEEWVDYIHSLRDGVLQAYTGIIHGLKDASLLNSFKLHVNGVLELVHRITEDPPHDKVLKSAVAVTGDLVCAYKEELTAHLVKANFLEKLIKQAQESDDPQCAQNATWLRDLIGKYKPAP